MQPLKANKLPLSSQAQQYLLGLVENGAYQAGDQLPSEADLAAQMGISRATLREALHNLEQVGIVVRKHGVGTFVTRGYGLRLESGLERLESILGLAERQGMQLEYCALQVQQERAKAELADKLRVDNGTLLTSVHRVITVDGTPVAYMLDVVLSSILTATDLDETFNGSVLDVLRKKLGVEVSQAVSDITALNADESLAQKLGIEPGQAVLQMEEVLFDKEGAIVEFSRNCFIPDFFRFHVVRR